MKRVIALSLLLSMGTPSLAQEPPRFEVEKECRTLPLEGARNWCLREERCNEKWLTQNRREMTEGVSRDAVAGCAKLAQASSAYRYWTLRHCLAPAPGAGDAACE